MDADAGPSLPEYRKEARSWLDDHVERRARSDGLRWGEGPDDVALFKNLTLDDERAHIEALRSWQREKSDAGYGSIDWPTEFGGAGLSGAHAREFSRLELEYQTPVGHESVTITMEIVAPTILRAGTADQKARYLHPMRRGDEMWCQMFSEPGAGSDLASLSTRAVSEGGVWVLNGQKVWTSGAQHADFGYVLCRSDPAAPKRQGLTAFVLPMDTTGVSVRPLRQMSGGSSFNEVFLTDVVLTDDQRMGQVGGGWSLAMTTLGFERSAVNKSSPSGGDLFERLVQLARQTGRSDDPLVRQRLAAIYAEGRVRTLTRRRVADSIRAGVMPGPEGSIGKLAWTEGLRSIAGLAAELLGPRVGADSGEWGTFAWTEFVNGVPGLRLAGGSDEIQRNTIAERVLGLPRDPGEMR